jgi:hypothetical protein
MNLSAKQGRLATQPEAYRRSAIATSAYRNTEVATSKGARGKRNEKQDHSITEQKERRNGIPDHGTWILTV